jgi:DNA-binding CsgD family transcriptional regulator/tetratricopeptide (TPR) repeat protein
VLSDDGTEVPASARDAVLARAARLSEAARTTLDLASLDSWRVEPDLVARAGDLDPATFDELVAVGLLRAEGPTLRFRHELARRAIESEVPPHRRGAGHEALLQALVDVDCDDNARLAYHAEAAGEPDLVRRFAPVAARRAAELGAHREAVAQYERALRHPPLDERELAELFDGYAEALAIVDRWPAAAGARERAIVLWHRLGDVRREGYDHRKLATVYWRLCRGAESVQSQQRAITLLEPLGADPELARAYMAHAFDVWRDDPVGGPQMLQRASDIADELGDPSLRSDVLNNVSVGKFALRTEWSPTMDEALRLGLESDDENSIARAYANGYQYFCMQYRFAEGERYWREGVRFSDEHDITTYSSCLRGRRSLALLDLGRWDEAEDVAGRVVGMQASPVNRLTSLVSVGLIRARRGLDGLEALEEAVAAGDGVDEPEWIALARTARAEAHWIAGELDAARADLRVVRVRITPVEYVEDAKLSVWEERLLGGARPASPAPGPWATWLTGDFAATAVHWDRLSCPYDAAMALADSEDETPLRDAISRFEALGAGAVARRIRQRMKDLGHRAAPIGARASTREHPMGLTRREDEVLALVCEGLTNDEIAARLVVSTRTVDHHVSAVLAKLGVGSRGAAAVRARKLGLVPATT